MGAACPFRQSRVIDPTMTNRRCFSRTRSMISHNYCVLLARRDTSNTMMVSPAWASCFYVLGGILMKKKRMCFPREETDLDILLAIGQ